VSLRLRIYLVIVGVTAAALLGLGVPHDLPVRGVHYAAWIAICAASESLWLPTLSGTGTVTMASSAGLASAMLWGQSASIWIAAASTLIAELLVLRKPWVRAVFNTSQITVTMWLACGAFALLGGPLGGLEHATDLPMGEQVAIRLLLPTLALFVVYLVVNRALVAVAVAWSTERPYLRVLREDWFYTERLVEDAAAFFLSPLMALSFRAIGYFGALLFYMPLRLFNESHKRFLELQRAQQIAIHRERMAAKGEMAASIGHELRNILTAISARAQLIVKESERGSYDSVPRNTQIILEQSQRMRRMSDDLMAYSSDKVSMEKVEVNALLQRTIEFVRAEKRFNGVQWDLQLSAANPELRADPGQLQQVFINLLQNAADAMMDQTPETRRIGITTTRDDRAKVVKMVFTDTGPGIPGSNLTKVFEPHFTTKKTGHGFGLSTTYRIIENHKGRITAESPNQPGQGALFTITLPMFGASDWS
jgi:signal transduction histidine kinase